jgi:Fe-S-cluster containining protein
MPNEIVTDLAYIQRTTQAQEDENLAFRTFVKFDLELSDRRLNALVQETTEEVWREIDCRTCANCCRTLHPLFSRAEVERIAVHLGTTVEDLRSRYLKPSEEGKYTTRQLPCPFLQENLCSIYAVRPAVCVSYPHLQRNFRSRLLNVLDNAASCPIVYNVLARVKERCGFGGTGPVRYSHTDST